jgi:hypothetical protein
MKIIKAIISWFSMLIAGMYGGQKNKGTRRFGIPGLALLSSWWAGFSVKDLALLLLIPILCIGYGENSFIYGWTGNDFLTRIIYGFFLSVPFIVYGWWRFVVAAVLLPAAFSIHAGSLGYADWFGDFLVEDIIRYGVLGGLIVFNIFWRRK